MGPLVPTHSLALTAQPEMDRYRLMRHGRPFGCWRSKLLAAWLIYSTFTVRPARSSWLRIVCSQGRSWQSVSVSARSIQRVVIVGTTHSQSQTGSRRISTGGQASGGTIFSPGQQLLGSPMNSLNFHLPILIIPLVEGWEGVEGAPPSEPGET